METGSNSPAGSTAPLPDATPHNWVDRFAPEAWRPYLRLARADRPIGTWLLLFPCWWSLGFAGIARGDTLPHAWYMVLFAVGALVMRGAGCAYNDYVDRDYDALVERTRGRPIPSGQVSANEALVFVAALAFVGLLVLLQFNWTTIFLGASSLLIVAVYPFMKRVTFWPQVILGLAFNWGALLGWTALTGSLSASPVLLYVGSVAWTIGYDTIYAHQDKEDDLMLGLKSTALRFGENTTTWVAGFYGVAVVAWALAAFLAGAHLITFIGLALVCLHLSWQVSTLDIDDADNCLRRFKSNRDVGAVLFLGIAADMMLSLIAGG